MKIYTLPKQANTVHTLDCYTYHTQPVVVLGLSSGALQTIPAQDQKTHHEGAILCVRFHPDGTQLCTGSDDRTVGLFSAKNGKIEFVRRSKPANSDVVGISYTETNEVVSCCLNGTVSVFSRTLVLKSRVKHDVMSMWGLVATKKHIVAQSDQGLHFLDSRGNEVHKQEKHFKGLLIECVFSRMDSDGENVFAGLGFNGSMSTVEIVSTTEADNKDVSTIATSTPKMVTNTTTRSMVGHTAPIECVSFNRKHKILAAASQDRSISLWSMKKPVPFLLLKNAVTSPFLDLRWSTCGQYLYFCTFNGEVKYLEFNEGELESTEEKLKLFKVESREGVSKMSSVSGKEKSLATKEVVEKMINKCDKVVDKETSTLIDTTNIINNTINTPNIINNLNNYTSITNPSTPPKTATKTNPNQMTIDNYIKNDPLADKIRKRIIKPVILEIKKEEPSSRTDIKDKILEEKAESGIRTNVSNIVNLTRNNNDRISNNNDRISNHNDRISNHKDRISNNNDRISNTNINSNTISNNNDRISNHNDRISNININSNINDRISNSKNCKLVESDGNDYSFKKTVGSYFVEYNNDCLFVTLNGSLHFKLHQHLVSVCCNSDYLGVSTGKSILVYRLDVVDLVVPPISMESVSLDIHHHNLLIVGDSKFKVINLHKKRELCSDTVDGIPFLCKKYFLTTPDTFYDPKMKVWLVKKPHSVYEHFKVCRHVGDVDGMKKACFKMIRSGSRKLLKACVDLKCVGEEQFVRDALLLMKESVDMHELVWEIEKVLEIV